MRVKRFNSNKEVLINTRKYLINWDKDSCSKPQTLVKRFLKPYWNQKIVLEEFRIPGSLLRIDLLCVSNKIVIEVSPKSTHNVFNKFFHNNSRAVYLRRMKADDDKLDWIKNNNFKYVELNDDDINDISPKYILEKFDIDIL